MSAIAIQISINGTHLNAEYELLYVEVKTEYNRIPYAELGFIDGDLAGKAYPISESDDFKPGNTIEIKMGYTGSTSPLKMPQMVFKGIVLKQGLQINKGASTLVIELSDAAVKMTIGRKSNVFKNMKDNTIISKLVHDNGLIAGSISTTTVQHAEIVQYAATDWDFMLCRAEANGLLISVKAGTINAKAPSMTGFVAATYEVGITEMYDLNLEVDGRHQIAEITGASWDVKNQQLTTPKKGAAFTLKQGNLKPAAIAKAIGGSSNALLTAVGWKKMKPGCGQMQQ